MNLTEMVRGLFNKRCQIRVRHTVHAGRFVTAKVYPSGAGAAPKWRIFVSLAD
jgi:hypothetical protein